MALRTSAAAQLADLSPGAPETEKAAAWAAEDEAAELEVRADLLDAERESLLQAALTHAPELPEAHVALAHEHQARHVAAERARDRSATARAELMLRKHVTALPDEHPVRARCAAYLKGDGALSLVTDPPGAEVLLYRYERRQRRLVAVPDRALGRAPLAGRALPMGSYLCVLRLAVRPEVHYPVRVGRGEHWDGLRPGASDPFPVWIPGPTDLGPDERYVPAGWFVAGDRQAYASAPEGTRLWCDPFAIRRFPVTNTEYLAFLDDLVARGLTDEAHRWVPREPAGQRDSVGAPIYGRHEDGRFRLVADAEGDLWYPNWPVVMVDWDCATALARRQTELTGLPWRLPWDFEREKAARGVDGRLLPWGDGMDSTFCCTRDSHVGAPLPVPVDSFPVDVSPYGVRGLAGNVRDWCADVWTPEAVVPADGIVRPYDPVPVGEQRAQRVDRGGSWYRGSGDARSAQRFGDVPGARDAGIGIRLARSLPNPEPRG